MVEEKIQITNDVGLNADVATKFVQVASKFTSRITVIYEETEVNGKSIMSLLTLAVAPGDELVIRAKGEDEHSAVGELAGVLGV